MVGIVWADNENKDRERCSVSKQQCFNKHADDRAFLADNASAGRIYKCQTIQWTTLAYTMSHLFVDCTSLYLKIRV